MAKSYKPAANRETYEKLYISEGKSSREISSLLGVCNNKVLKDLRRFNIQIRNRSEAQLSALSTGKSKHPTWGMKHSQSTRELIGIRQTRRHAERAADPAYKEWRSRIAKERFESMTEEAKEAFRENARRSLIKSGKNGSQLERFLLTRLQAEGYNCVPQAVIMAANEDMRVDLYLPEWGVVIEVDGITHLEDVYNDPEGFAKKKSRDETKNALLIADRYVVIRFGYRKQIGLAKREILINKILQILDKLQFGRPAPENALFKIYEEEL